jgi:uncharacterized membrane protein
VFFKKEIFTAEQKQQIVAAIREAEKVTSGQIKVHLEPKCTNEPLKRAIEVFHKLEMHKTTHKNAVLIYIAWQDKKFAIAGDRGIHAVVPANFWDGTKEVMKAHFKKGEFLEGILFAIKETGLHMEQYFPHQDNDKNELSDEISEG